MSERIGAIAPGLGVLILGYSAFEGIGSALMIPPIYILATMFYDDVASRARAYLQANCAYCHSDGGEARTTGLDLTFDETSPMQLGVCKMPIAAGKAAEGQYYDIVPGHPEQSILVYRMESTAPAIAMPEIGRSLEHFEAVQLVSDWINAMPAMNCQ